MHRLNIVDVHDFVKHLKVQLDQLSPDHNITTNL